MTTPAAGGGHTATSITTDRDGQIAAAEEVESGLNSQMSTLETEVRNITATAETMRSEAEAAETVHAAEIAAAEDVAWGLKSQVSTLETEMRDMTATIETMGSEAETLAVELSEWRERAIAADDWVSSVHAAEIAAAQNVASGLNSQFSTLETETRDMTTTIETMGSEAEALALQSQQWRQRAVHANDMALGLNSQISMLETKMRDISAAVETMRSEAEAAETTYAAEIAAAKGVASGLNSQVSDMSATIETMGAEADTLTADLRDWRERAISADEWVASYLQLGA